MKAALGAASVLTGDDIPARNEFDQTLGRPTRPAALLLPRTTDAVAAALRLCHEAGQPVVTQGGMTGLAGGAHPKEDEVALSLERMRGVEEIDPVAATLTALAGTPLAEIQAAAEQAGFHCGIDLGARGSCSIGGNVATNAGGNNVLRYGMTRHNVLGLEAVQADGTVLTSLNKMLKNNTGYDWKQLFIGSEGTLGVVTRVVLALHPQPGPVETALLACPSMEAAVGVLTRLGAEFGSGLMMFEGMWAEFIDTAVTMMGLPAPFERPHELLVLTEIAPGPGGAERVTDALGVLMEDGLVEDAIVARSGNDAARLWAYRESPYEYYKHLASQTIFDVSIPRADMAAAVADLRALAAQRWPSAMQVVFGHIADSNIHIVIGPTVPGVPTSPDEKRATEAAVYDVVAHHAGSVSAEHGIGRNKRPYLAHSRTPAELALMRTLKTALDPKGILNPGRVL
nr:FAD-binding oxidoreductase [Acuticoccus mangrovi]